MREKKFTPGPWYWSHSEDDDYCYIEHNGGSGDICRMHHEPDANLIAAAPELLEALEGMVDFETRARKQQEKRTGHEYLTSFEAKVARAAIAKAYGEDDK